VTEPHTPTPHQARARYMNSEGPMSGPEFDRMLARVRADALDVCAADLEAHAQTKFVAGIVRDHADAHRTSIHKHQEEDRMTDIDHIVYKGEVTLCQESADDVTVAMFIDDATCEKCLAVNAILDPAFSQCGICSEFGHTSDGHVSADARPHDRGADPCCVARCTRTPMVQNERMHNMGERVEWGFRTPNGAIVGPYSSSTDAVMMGGMSAPLVWRTVSDWQNDDLAYATSSDSGAP
jgi:hypothetical protein